MRKFGFSPALISSPALLGGVAGFSGDPYRFVPIAGSRNIGRNILKSSRNSIRYPEPNKIGGRQQKRFARQFAAGQIKFFDHDANRRMIAGRAINHSGVEIAEKIERFDFAAHGEKVDTARRVGTEPAIRKPETDFDHLTFLSDNGTIDPGTHRDRLRKNGLIAYDKSARTWKLTEAGRASLNR